MYLTFRESGYRFQIAVPSDLWPVLGKTPVRIPLGRVSAAVARRITRLLSGETERLFIALRTGDKGAMAPSDVRDAVIAELFAMVETMQADAVRFEEIAERRVKNAVELTETKLLAEQLRQQEAFGARLHGLGSGIADVYEQIRKIRQSPRPPAKFEAMLAGLEKHVLTLSEQVQISLDGGPPRPLLSEVIDAWIAIRRGLGIGQDKVTTDHNRILDFKEFAGDRPLNKYSFLDFQRWSNLLVRVPQNHDKKPEIREMSREQAADYNDQLPPKRKYPTLTDKTIDTNYLSPLRVFFREMAAEHKFDYPLRDIDVKISKDAAQSKARTPFDVEALNAWFRVAAREATADKKWLPLLASVTGARIGELVFLQGKDVYRMEAKDGKGHWVLDLKTNVIVDEEERKRQIKNPTSRRLIALHEIFEEVGFIAYAQSRDEEDWIFPACFYDARKRKKTEDPADAASKRMNRMLRTIGIHEEQTQVFHSTRHNAKQFMRLAKVDKRTHDLQTGHALVTPSDQYGSKTLVAEEMDVLASIPLPEGLDVSPYTAARSRKTRDC